MFIKNDMIYAEAGHILRSEKVSGYQLPVYCKDVTEDPIDIDNMVIMGDFIDFGNMIIMNHKDYSYAQWKSHIIKWRYSNDDQIALLLNKDDSSEDMFYFTKMGEWRNWASKLAKSIISLNA